MAAYGFAVRLNIPYEEAVRRVTAALKDEGFGILTEIDVQATLKQKLDADFRRYVILGACNPPAGPPGSAGRPGRGAAASLQRDRLRGGRWVSDFRH